MTRSSIVRVLIGILIVVLAAIGAAVIVRAALTCRPDTVFSDIIARYRTDPFLSATPTDGQPISESVRGGRCIEWQGETIPESIGMSRSYQVSMPYTSDQLHRLFDPLAAEHGWAFIHEDPDTDTTHTALYFKGTIGGRETLAVIGSLPAGSNAHPDGHRVYVTAVDGGPGR